MANVHRIGDYQNGNPPNNPGQGQNMNPQQMFGMPFQSQLIASDPKDENFFDMLKTTLCPQLKLLSATLFLFVVVTIFYVVSLLVGPESYVLFSPSTSSLIKMGALARSYIQQGQYWRFLTAPFLNPDILSFAMSQFYLMVLGGNIELYVTAKGIGLGYFLGGIEGGLMACYFANTQDIFTASSMAFQGLFGPIISLVILNWYSETMVRMRCCLIVWFVIIIFLIVLGGTMSFVVGNLSTLGLLMGTFVGLWSITPQVETDYERKCKIIGQVSTGFLLFLSVFIFMQLQ